MFRVVLTGNAAAGKSTVTGILRELGAHVLDADQFARDAVRTSSAGLDAVVQRFGPGILQQDGSLDRAALRRLVMDNPGERAALNAIVHPIVARLSADAEARLDRDGARIVVHDIPLLFEALDPASFDAIVLVDAPLAARRARLIARGLEPAEADALIAAQLPAEDKRARSHFVIDNGGSIDALPARVREVWKELQGRAGVA